MDLAKLWKEPIGQLVRRKLQYLAFRQRWNIGVTRHAASVVAGLDGSKKQHLALNDLVWMDESCDAFAADPFILRRSGTEDEYHILFEWYPWSEKRGRIHCVDFRDGKFGGSRISLDSQFHLSYPYVMPRSGDLVMIPEHSASGELALYRITGNGVATNKETLTRNLSLLDSTIVYYNEAYWMFATEAGPQENADLHIFYAESLQGPWAAHAQNPVKSDRSNARPAGQFIFYKGKMFRPAQDCATHYGSAIIINEVKDLTEDSFEEAQVSEIRPQTGSRYDYGLHTISSAGEYTVIDGARIESLINPRLDKLGRYLVSKAAQG